MRQLILLVVLCACARSAPAPVAGFRAPAAPIYSNAVLEVAKLSGSWRQAGEFASPDAPACAPGGLEITPDGAGLRAEGRLCLNGRAVPVSGRLDPVGPGRFALRGGDPGGIGQAWWVLWADTAYRSLAVGTPSGAFGFLLDRGTLPPDRRRAAAEVLDFNGYDVARLR